MGNLYKPEEMKVIFIFGTGENLNETELLTERRIIGRDRFPGLPEQPNFQNITYF